MKKACSRRLTTPRVKWATMIELTRDGWAEFGSPIWDAMWDSVLSDKLSILSLQMVVHVAVGSNTMNDLET